MGRYAEIAGQNVKLTGELADAVAQVLGRERASASVVEIADRHELNRVIARLLALVGSAHELRSMQDVWRLQASCEALSLLVEYRGSACVPAGALPIVFA